ncbi:MAG: hypothetical protein JO151_03845 [Verrucomicrobia bacterium]|nr:hypothetical protein [Verrucomicrobiota bacterium]
MTIDGEITALDENGATVFFEPPVRTGPIEKITTGSGLCSVTAPVTRQVHVHPIRRIVPRGPGAMKL